MGTGLEADQQLCSMSDNVGILPRSVHHLFTGIEMLREEAIQEGKTPPEFRVQAQFLELYNEEIIDLLEPTTRVRLEQRLSLLLPNWIVIRKRRSN